jgi:hypothetical protein
VSKKDHSFMMRMTEETKRAFDRAAEDAALSKAQLFEVMFWDFIARKQSGNIEIVRTEVSIKEVDRVSKAG